MSKEIKDIQQDEVLSTFGYNQIVSASAGSGKTTIMIKKILDLIKKNKISIKKILVLTYTKAAATEMKQRLERELSLLQEDDFYKMQLDELPLADITTFHAFYQKIVKKYFYLLNISSNFKIADENISASLKDIALNKTLEEFSKNNSSYYTFYEMFSRGRSNKPIKEIISTFNTYFLNIAESNWKNKALELFGSDFCYDYIHNYISKNLKSMIDSLKVLSVKAKDLGFDSYVKNINSTLSQVEINFSEMTISQICDVLKNYKTITLYESKDDEIKFASKVRYIKKSLKDFIDKIIGFNFGDEEDITVSKKVCKETMQTLFALEEMFTEKYLALKKEKNVFDFDDLEKFTFLILNNDDIKQELKSDYEYIFVDEFQDANARQEEILKLISRENNRFMVGDVKQSIYQFRQSKPDIFLELEERYKNEKNSKSQKLTSNFRSNEVILNFINDIFDFLMTKSNSGIDYTQNRFKPAIKFINNDLPIVEIDILAKQDNENLEDKREVYSVKNHTIFDDEEDLAEKEAIIVAEKILEIRKRKIYDRKKECMRDVEYGDIAILLRNRGSYLTSFANKLSSLGIPLIQNLNSNLLETKEGQTFITLLKVIKNPTSDLQLGLLMLSTLGDFSEDELLDIKKSQDESLLSQCEHFSGNDILKQKIDTFLNNLKSLRKDSKYLDQTKAFFNFYSNINLEERLFQTQGGQKSYLYYETLAKVFEGNITINEFLNSKDMFLHLPKLERQPSCVEITTIHASKGLEYPIVFVCNAGENFNKTPQKNYIVINDKLGVSSKYFDLSTNKEHSSIFYETIKLYNKKEEFAERLRLLYVALSRAQNHLYIVGTSTVDKLSPIHSEFDISNQTSYLALILGALGENVIDKLKNGNMCIKANNYILNVYENSNQTKQEINNHTSIAYKESEESNKLLESINYTYKFSDETKIALKNSVSSLNKDDENASINYSPNKLTVSEHLLDIEKNELGTLYHKVLQFIDFNKIRNNEDVKTEIDNLIKNGRLSEDTYKYIDNDIIYNTITILKDLCSDSTILKEQFFMMKVPHCEVTNSNIKDDILIQGIVDLIILGEKNIIVDYKLTSTKSTKVLVDRYKRQILLYKKATELALGKKVDECYLLSLRDFKLIKIN